MCARSVLVCRRVLGVALGAVVAGRFWCSYAWVSLTQTACARPRAPACLCAPVRARVCAPLGGGVRWCAVVWCVVWCGAWCRRWVCCGVGSGCLPFLLGGGGACLLYSLWAVVCWCSVLYSYLYSYLCSSLPSLLPSLLSISMTIKNGI